MDAGLSLRDNTRGCGGGTALGQGACYIKGAPRFSPSLVRVCSSTDYINDLPEGIGPTVRLVADDTVMYLTIDRLTNRLTQVPNGRKDGKEEEEEETLFVNGMHNNIA